MLPYTPNSTCIQMGHDFSVAGNALRMERIASSSGTHHGLDLESGIRASETKASSFVASGRSLPENVWGKLRCTQSGNGLVGEHSVISSGEYEVPAGWQQKEEHMGFSESVLSGFKKQGSQGLDLVKTENKVCGSSEKIGHGDGKVVLKPGWKKPPRPPRAVTGGSKERHIKSIYDADYLRRARLKRIRSLRKQKVKESSSTKTILWAWLFTVFFLAIVIIQGTKFSPSDSSGKSDQTSSLLNNFSNGDYFPTSLAGPQQVLLLQK